MNVDRATSSGAHGVVGDPASAELLSQLSSELIGQAQPDMLSHRAALSLVPGLADVAFLDVCRDAAVSRFYGIRGQPQDDQTMRDRIRALVPDAADARSAANAALRDGRVVLRGELGETERESFSLVLMPIRSPDGAVIASLGLVTFGMHDRYGRSTLATVEETAARIGRALALAQTLERARDGQLSARSHFEVLQDTVQTMERSLRELREQVRTLELENAALRAYSTTLPLATHSAA